MTAVAVTILIICIIGALMLALDYAEEPSLLCWVLGEVLYITVGAIAAMFLT